MIRVDSGPSQPSPGRLPPGERVYAIGDIHGRHDLLTALLDRVREQMAAAPEIRQTAVFLGDYIDRGPQARQVLETLASLAIPEVAIRCLRGNHEQFLLEFLDRPLSALAWVFSGGADTLRSYGIAPPEFSLPFDRAPYVAAAAELARVLPAEHRAFLSALPLYWRAGNYCFVHAGVRPGVALDAQQASDLLWIDRPFLDSPDNHGAVIVHGHSIVREAEIRANRIGLDTGAFASDRLTCLILEADRLRVLRTRREEGS